MARALAKTWIATGTFAAGLASVLTASAASSGPESAMRELAERNERLEAQVRDQRELIDRLAAEVAAMRDATERQERALRSLAGLADAGAPERGASRQEAAVRITGEAGLAFFRTGATGQFPNSEFRVDDAKVAIEARVWKNAYVFAEFDLLSREANDPSFQLGEFYADFEDVARDRLLNVRVGRMNIPFGEEYQRRRVMTNPLISHSLGDLWGIDEGIEAYGEAGRFSYVVAVQNGGHSLLRDYTSDKSVTARVGYDPHRSVHLSASAMRTGDLPTRNDTLSELWFGGAFFRALGPAATTTAFNARLYELDAVGRWRTGHVAAAAGWVRFDDDDTTADNARRLDYHFVEALQKLGDKLHAAARYSTIRAPEGYPLAGWGQLGTYFFGGLLTQRLERLSVGFAYHFGPPLVLKFEYTRETGRFAGGAARPSEDVIATEVGLKF